MKVKIAKIKWTIKDMEEVEKYQFFYEKLGIDLGQSKGR